MDNLKNEDAPSLTNESPSDVVGALLKDLDRGSTHASKTAENRRYARAPYLHHTILTWGKGLKKKSLVGDSFDISRTGVCLKVHHSQRIDVGTEVTLQLSPTSTLVGGVSLYSRRSVKAVIARVWRESSDEWFYGLRFKELLKDSREIRNARIKKILSGVLVVAGIVAIVALKISDLRWFWYAPFYRIYGILGGIFFVSRAVFALIYRPPKDKGYLPKVSVIVSVKNEEKHIAETVRRIFSVRYPLSKMELIVIDDGSTDNTWGALEKVKPYYSHLHLFRFKENLGKRHGMALGAERATGEILIYVDSGSYVDEEGIYQIVQPFVDKNVGAVAGHTRVILEPGNIISKMESVRYFISHQFFKTAESLFGVVTCCPGAFSAYRRDVVLRVLPKWLNQTFFGVKSTFGDDRSLTNFVLRTHRVLYTSAALCVTYVPSTWKQFFTQQLRWKKSWARETTVASRILIKKHPFAVISYFVGIVVTLLSPIVFIRAVVLGPLLFSQSCVPYLLGLLLVHLFLCLFFLVQTGEAHWSYGFLFAISYLTILCWQTYWATLTINKTQWGTR